MLTYCVAERMSLSELAGVGLPGAEHNFNEVYRDFFSTEAYFLDCVRALQASGEVPERNDGTYRLSDAYRLPSLVVRATRVVIGKKFSASPGIGLHVFPPELDDAWWEPILGFLAGRAAVRETRRVAAVRDPATGRLLRTLPTKEEHDAEIERVRNAVIEEEKQLVEALPSDTEWWRTRLYAHATIVKQLREIGRVKLARLCAYHLDVAALLAERRLDVSRRCLRVLVGIGSRWTSLVVGRPPVEETEFLLTEASYSPATRAHDRAIDFLERSLRDYNSAALPELCLDRDDVQNFVDHLHQAGLDDWTTQLVTETWDVDLLRELNEDQRISIVYSRVRSMCALLEESLRSFVEIIGDPEFTKSVESQGVLSWRLGAFLKGPAGRVSPVSPEDVLVLNNKWRVKPPVTSSRLESCLDALEMPSGNPAPLPGPDSVRTLAGLVFVRNLTSHRYPIVISNVRVDWFETWGKHLRAVNRTVEWSGLALWALTKRFR